MFSGVRETKESLSLRVVTDKGAELGMATVVDVSRMAAEDIGTQAIGRVARGIKVRLLHLVLAGSPVLIELTLPGEYGLDKSPLDGKLPSPT